MKYIAFYDSEEFLFEKRAVAPSAANVVLYMAKVMSRFTNVEIISPSRTLMDKGFYKARTTKIAEKIWLKQPFSIGVKTVLGRIIVLFLTQLWLLWILLFYTKKGETIVVYHSLSIMNVIKLTKILKKLHIILEIREIYSDVKDSYEALQSSSKKKRKKEELFFALGDGYIFPTVLLNNMINKDLKNYVIGTGIYESENTKIIKGFNDNKIHVVYAGTLRKEKGGAIAAAAAAAFLPKEKYQVHILGYGSSEDIQYINEVIQKGNGNVEYNGLLRGQKFVNFLAKCDIGVATQVLEGSFVNTSFPSKILTYLCNGLYVVSGKIDAVVKSPVGDLVSYYDEQEPRRIAEAIMSVKIENKSKIQQTLQKLDADLEIQLMSLIAG